MLKSFRMSDQQLNLRELKEQVKALSYTKIQRQKKCAPIVDLTAWNGVSAEAAGGAAFCVSSFCGIHFPMTGRLSWVT